MPNDPIPQTTSNDDVAGAFMRLCEALGIPVTVDAYLEGKCLRMENERLRGQNVRLLRRLERAGLLGEPVEALNGEEQRDE